MARRSRYDAVIVGSGHNGLVAACYLAKAGKSVLVLERGETLGGATCSRQVFAGFDARLSVYSYLVSLLPEKIVTDLGLRYKLATRKTASWTPQYRDGVLRELLVRNGDDAHNRQAFVALTGSERDYQGYLRLLQMQQQIAAVVWPSLLEPMVTRDAMRRRLPPDATRAWQALIEQPLGETIEDLIEDDLIRGMLFTDAKIGLPTHPHDPTLLQNRCFLYHVIGRGDGQWRVPVGGMGRLIDELIRVAQSTGRVTFETRSPVETIAPSDRHCKVTFRQDDRSCQVEADHVLCNASAQVLHQLLDPASSLAGKAEESLAVEGSGFKVNMLLKRLPKTSSPNYSAEEVFSGTVHIDEGYRQMQASYESSMAGKIPDNPPAEIYCHTLTDATILSEDLRSRGYHTITLFGLDLPYRLFKEDASALSTFDSGVVEVVKLPAARGSLTRSTTTSPKSRQSTGRNETTGTNKSVVDQVVTRYLDSINRYLSEPLQDCLAVNREGEPCIEAMSAVDLERTLRLPQGNIFHGDLSWPFVESDDEAGQWGVETSHPRALLCGSAALRGGAVSGIPGHNAAMKLLLG